MKYVVKFSMSVLVDAETRQDAINAGRIEVMKHPENLIAREVSRDPIMIHDIRVGLRRD